MFVNEYMLAALVAVVVPWIIEWLLRRRRRIIELPTIRFLLLTTQQRKVRLQDFLLLLLRTLVIAVLVLAIARPIFRREVLSPQEGETRHAVLIFDTTYSNGQQSGADSALALARRMGSEVVAGLPRGTPVTVAVLGDRVSVPVERSTDLPGVRSQIERLELNDRGGFIGYAIAWAEKFLAEQGGPGAEVYIFSDMQESTWGRPAGDTGEPQATQSFVVGAEPHEATFAHTFLAGGEHLLKVVLQGDAHTMDNVRYRLVGVPESHRVLIVDERGERSLLESDSGLLRLAICPPQKTGGDKLSAFSAAVCPPEQFAQQSLADYRVVALNNLANLAPQMVSALESFVAEGGALLVLCGDRVAPFEHNRRLLREGRGLLPCGLEARARPAEAKDAGLIFEPPELAALSLPAAPNGGQGIIGHYLSLNLQKAEKAPQVIARFSDGAPAMVEKAFGRGRVLLFAGSVGLGWGELPLSEQFPVVVQELLRRLIGDPDREVNLPVGGVFDQPVLMTSRHLTLKRPDGRKARLTPTKRQRDALRYVTCRDTDRVGVYQVDTLPEILAKRRFVVNMAPEEPDLRRLDEARFALAFGEPQVVFLPSAARVRSYVEGLHSVQEAAGGVLGFLFFLLAGEMYLAYRFGRRRMG